MLLGRQDAARRRPGRGARRPRQRARALLRAAGGSDGDSAAARERDIRAAEIALAACGVRLIEGDAEGDAAEAAAEATAEATADESAATLAVWLPLGQRERATQHNRAEARVRANLKRAVRGSVMRPRAATGEIQLHLKFSPLTHQLYGFLDRRRATRWPAFDAVVSR